MTRVNHFEFTAEDADRAIEFYEKAFGWKIEKWDGPIDYWNIRTGDPSTPGIDGGISIRSPENTGIVNTIDVSSCDEALKNIEENGGKIIRQKFAVTGVGWLAYFLDTEGNKWAIMEEDPKAK